MRPMYYEFPEAPEAYSTMFDRQVENFCMIHIQSIVMNVVLYCGTICPMQYFFGPDILVAPITRAMNPAVNMTSKQIWIPEVLFPQHNVNVYGDV